ncbi:hypothetical protein Cgig2_011313 [Carnegiea gigantea]|uniref:Uncharacterized protein n=1 Tax=Carnegiea gigantea TaxID=171969 RepID=A0A9Q1GLC8_9CARY|nr:hypothetical protein Cgig2_011313 [Carnegiea gigantea]
MLCHEDEGKNGDCSLGPHGRPLYTWRAADSRWHPPRESRRHTRQPEGVRPFRLSTDLPGPNGASEDEELMDALSEDELLDECLEEEPGEPVREEVLELVEAASASGLDWDGAEQGLPCVLSASNLSGDMMRGVDLADAGHHPTINKGREVGELQVLTLHLGPVSPSGMSSLDE